MNPVVHFEMPAEDRKRAAEFYHSVFGWKAELLGPEMGEYVLVTTTDTGENGRPKNPGAINGGFFQKTGKEATQHPSVVISVDDLADSIKKVKSAGGLLIGEPQEIPGIGKFIYFKDSEGNIAGMLQPLPME